MGLWNKWYSYLIDIELEISSSEINEYLEVILTSGRIQLCTKKAIYSNEKRYDNFRRLFERMDFEKMRGKQVLLLGLGLGSVIQLLEAEKQNFYFTAVELDEEIIRLAEKYILHNLDTPINIISADALTYVKLAQEKFDLICMDIFIDDVVPDQFKTKEFCELLNNLLTESGTLVYNCPAFNRASSDNSKDFFENSFKKVFPEGKNLHIHKNYMLLNYGYLLEE